jgi:hypothetical protein
MEDFWKALLNGLAPQQDEKHAWLVVPGVVVAFVIIATLFGN